MTLKDKIEGMEREEIVNALMESGGVMARAARRLGITERMIGYKIKKLSISIRKEYEREEGNKEKISQIVGYEEKQSGLESDK